MTSTTSVAADRIRLAELFSLHDSLDELFSYRDELDFRLREAYFLSDTLWNFEIFGETCTPEELSLIDSVNLQFSRFHFRTHAAYDLVRPGGNWYFDLRCRFPLLDHSNTPPAEYEIGYRGNDMVRRARSMIMERFLRGVYQRSIPAALWNYIENTRSSLKNHEKVWHSPFKNSTSLTAKGKVLACARSICAETDWVQKFARPASREPELIIIPITKTWALRMSMELQLVPLHGVEGIVSFRLFLCDGYVGKKNKMSPFALEIPYYLIPSKFGYDSCRDIDQFQIGIKAHLFILGILMEKMIALTREWISKNKETTP
jgi:hypothetical protein